MKSQKIIIGVLGLPINTQGQFLLGLRHEPTRPQTHNKWEIMGGGLEYGETPRETLHREIREELGVGVDIVYPHPIIEANTWNFNQHGKHVVLLTYIVQLQSLDITLSQENTDFGWFYLDEIAQLDHLPKLDIICQQADDLIKEHQLIRLLK